MKHNKEMKFNKQEKKEPIEVSKVVSLKVLEVEEESIMVNIDGWRMRVYFDQSLNKEQKEKFHVNREIEVKYFGDIEDVHSLRLLPLK
jgi:ribosomal protein S1